MRLDGIVVADGLQLGAQRLDVRIDRTFHAFLGVAPDPVHQLRAGKNAAGGVDLSFAAGMGGDIMALMGSRLYPATTSASVLARGAIVVVIAALASLYPAWQASRKEPAAALHHV